MEKDVKRNHYDDKFKRDAVKALLKSGKPVIEMALILGVEQSILHRWKKKFGPELADTPQSPASQSIELDEIHTLKIEIAAIKASMKHLCNIFRKCIGERYQTSEPEE